ncbi:MAG: hypothetical protein R3A11_06865 [Bdellovibrionota bacterium]
MVFFVGFYRQEGLHPALFLSFDDLFVASVFVYLGIRGLDRIHIRIDNMTVRYKRTNLILVPKQWSAHLTEFEGVLPKEDYISDSDGDSGRTEFVHELIHKSDKSKNIELYRSRSNQDHRIRGEELATLLQLPLLYETKPGTFDRRMPAEFNLSIRERVAKGFTHVPSYSLRPPGKSIKLVYAKGQEILELSQLKGVIGGLVCLVLGGIVLYFVGWGKGAFVGYVAGGMFTLLGILMTFGSPFSKEVVIARHDELITFHTIFGKAWGVKKTSASDIEEIKLFSGKNHGHRLKVVGDRCDLEVGSLLNKQEKKWLQSYLIQKLGR